MVDLINKENLQKILANQLNINWNQDIDNWLNCAFMKFPDLMEQKKTKYIYHQFKIKFNIINESRNFFEYIGKYYPNTKIKRRVYKFYNPNNMKNDHMEIFVNEEAGIKEDSIYNDKKEIKTSEQLFHGTDLNNFEIQNQNNGTNLNNFDCKMDENLNESSNISMEENIERSNESTYDSNGKKQLVNPHLKRLHTSKGQLIWAILIL